MTNERKQTTPIVYVALGDSTGAGVGAKQGGGYPARLLKRMERIRPDSRLVNLCVSGATTGDVLRSQVGRVAAGRPGLVTLGIGINDLSRNRTVEDFGRDFEAIARRLRADTDAPVVVTNIPDITSAPAVPAFLRDEARRRIRLFNQRIAEIIARNDLMPVDIYTNSHEIIPEHPEFFSPDGFHPSDAGYEYWAHAMWPVVKKAIDEGGD
jgi:acyl-CoA thioesterase I